MALTKNPVNISFASGIETKTDKWQLQPGQFRAMTNTVFNKMGQLAKRNGFGLVTDAPAGSATLSTLSGGLVALGNTCQSYNADSGQLTNAGMFQPMKLSATSLVRRATGQTTVDVAVSDSGLACSVWLDANGTSYYQVSDSVNGQIVVVATTLPSGATLPRVAIVGLYFIITYLQAPNSLSYTAVPINNPISPLASATLSTQVASNAPYDIVSYNNSVYVAFVGSDGGGGAIRITQLTSTLHQPTTRVVASITASRVAISVDSTNGTVWVAYFHTDTITAMSFSNTLVPILASTTLSTGLTKGINGLTITAVSNVMTAVYEVNNTYPFGPKTKTDYLAKNTMTISGTAGTDSVVLRGVGLGSKSVYVPELSQPLVIASYGQAYQPTYFLINLNGDVLARFAYSNGVGYATTQILPSLTINSSGQLQAGYLIADQISAVNKLQGEAGSSIGVYAQTGINLISFTLGGQTAALEIGGSLHPSGGMLWQYDGEKIREHSFNVWPEDLAANNIPYGGGLQPQTYFYQAVYEWTDAAGQIHRSAPSVPYKLDNSAIVPQGASATATAYSSAATSIVLSSVTGFFVGQTIANTTTPGSLDLATVITAINTGTNTLTVTPATLTTSGSADIIRPTSLGLTATFLKNATTIQVGSTSGLRLGQRLFDLTTPATIQALTTITSIDSTTNTVGLSLPTLAASAADTLQTASTSFAAKGTVGALTMNVGKLTDLNVGQFIQDSTSPGSLSPNTTITRVYPLVTFTATAASTATTTLTVSSSAGLVVGQYLYDQTTPGNLNPTVVVASIVDATHITIGSGTLAAFTNDTIIVPQIDVSTPLLANIAGDTLITQPVSFRASFTTATTTASVDSVAALFVGQVVTDYTTPSNLTSGTTIATINAANNTITFNQVPAGSTASEVLATPDILSNTIYIPTLRQTYKTGANTARIVIYRWSTANQVYYQVTNMLKTTGDNPLLINDPTVDYLTFTDVLPDEAIVGNNIIYTNGGVLENICAPAATAMTLFQSRLFLADAEDNNLIWFSKQVIESTPVEMSDFLTLYVAPTTGAQGSTGPITALASMDNNLIVFKRDAIYYINGNGPDITGSNGSFSDPVFITSTVGCTNPQSIVLTPNGIMFQSDKGIWILGRDLSTSYIGAPAEDYTLANVTSAIAVPGTNQVRFTLDNTTAVMYDYYYAQWGNWKNISALSSVVYQNLHTYLDTYGQIVQETPNAYLDVSTPVLIGFTTAWFNLAGLQGFERFYSLNLLGQYITPHFLQVQIGFDYNPGITQTIMIDPINYTAPYGSDNLYGNNTYGGLTNVEKWRVFPNRQKCGSFQITIQEIYDPSQGVVAGAGLTLSGLQCLVGIKRGTRTQSAQTSVG